MADAPPPLATTLGIISKPLTVKLGQTAALFLSAFAAGQTATVSLLTVPALLQTPSPALLVRQWRTFFDRGLLLGPGCIVPSSLLFGWLAWREPSTRTVSWRLYTAAAGLLAGTVPYTMALVNGVNGELKRRSGGGGGEVGAERDVEAGGECTHWGCCRKHADFFWGQMSKRKHTKRRPRVGSCEVNTVVKRRSRKSRVRTGWWIIGRC